MADQRFWQERAGALYEATRTAAHPRWETLLPIARAVETVAHQLACESIARDRQRARALSEGASDD